MVRDDGLLGVVLARLEATPLESTAEMLLLEALEGDEALDRALDSNSPGRRAEPTGNLVDSPMPVGAYLRSVTVCGFRGIGAPVTLPIEPGPGLTVVAGRNGSGKSSFAEALEVLLTGTTNRWKGRSAVWTTGWRSLHNAHAEISAEFLVEGVPAPATVTRRWADDAADIEDSVLSVQVAGEPRGGAERLGWGPALEHFRPFLSHSELEALLGAPKVLHDQLNSLLGLEDLDAAAKRLSAARRHLEAGAKAPRDALPALREQLGTVDDERAARALDLLGAGGGKKVDLEALESLTMANGPAAKGAVGVLHRLQTLNAPDRGAVQAVQVGLEQAAERLVTLGGSSADDAATTAALLEAALAHFDSHGPGDCPVCGRLSALDDTWGAATRAKLVELRHAAADMDLARFRARSELNNARSLVTVPPSVLADTSAFELDTSEACEAWEAWAQITPSEATATELSRMAQHLKDRYEPLVEALGDLHCVVDAELGRLQDQWAPVSRSMQAWCVTTRAAEAARTVLDGLKKAEKWLKEANGDIRRDRFAPFVEQTIEYWRQLRQESNVDVVQIQLTGAANRSQVDFDVTVDGAPADALGVMSQGEINALALSVFLPRATMSASPFRFLIIDDPVQAMDPSKVVGLARVLASVAADRQVIVFTHDDRLPQAVRRLDLGGRIVQITRRADSVIQVHPAGDPCVQLLADAGQVAKDGRVPVAVAARVVPGICRSAIETVFMETTRRRWLAAGTSHQDVEAALSALTTTNVRAALAIFDDTDRGGDVLGWFNRQIGPWAANIYQTCNKGSHGPPGATFDPATLVTDTSRLVAALRKKVQ